MRRYRRPASDALPAGLSAEMVDILLAGWGSPLPPGGYGDDAEVFGVFLLSDEDWRQVWQTHRELLLAEWRRRGNLGPCWGQFEFERGES